MIRLVITLAALGVLASCGVRGNLQRPDPMWNREEAIARECARAAARNEPLDPRCEERALDPQ